MRKQVAVPTYKRFITGPIQQFDERHTGYSRGDRGEIPGLKESFERGLKTKDQRNVPGFTREDYAVNMAGCMIDTLVRRTVFSRESLPTRWQIPLSPASVSDPEKWQGPLLNSHITVPCYS